MNKKKIITIILVLLVILLGGASIYVATQLSTRKAVAPTAPESKPAASETDDIEEEVVENGVTYVWRGSPACTMTGVATAVDAPKTCTEGAFNDDFSGANIDQTKWDYHSGGTVSQTGGEIIITLPSGTKYNSAVLQPKNMITGEFQVEVDIKRTNTATQGGGAALIFNNKDWTNQIAMEIRKGTGNQNDLVAYGILNGVSTEIKRVAVDGLVATKVKMSRSSVGVSFYYKGTAGNWVELENLTTGYYSGDGWISLHVNSTEPSFPAISGEFDNFKFGCVETEIVPKTCTQGAFNDDFESASIDPVKWETTVNEEGRVAPSQANGKLKIEIPAGKTAYTAGIANSKNIFTGDFQAEVDMRLISATKESQHMGIMFHTLDFKNRFRMSLYKPNGTGPTKLDAASVKNENVNNLGNVAVVEATMTKVKIVRTGSSAVFSYKNSAGSWVELGTATNVFTGDMYVELFTDTSEPDFAAISGEFDNFKFGCASLAVDGGWSEWSDCSATACGTTGTITRICNNPTPLNGGLECLMNNGVTRTTPTTRTETAACTAGVCECTPSGVLTCDTVCPTTCGLSASSIACTDSCGGTVSKACAATSACGVTATPTATTAPTTVVTVTEEVIAQVTPTILPETGIFDLPGIAAFGGGLFLAIIGILLAL